MSDDLVKRLRAMLEGNLRPSPLGKEAADRIEELEKMLAMLVFCEDAEFYPSAIESASPYCIDFEKWHEDACEALKGGKDE